ncbi:MAG: hypothetical protein JWM41_4004 [Gemmatimonadetes bacterium]|nr:hypothetical protein [Gemmatimonadota bacterium]
MQEIANFSKHTTRRPAAIVTAIVGLAFISACSSDSVGVGGSTQSQLSFSTSGTSSSNAVSAALVPVTVGAHTLDLAQVTLTIDRAELKRAHTDACAGDNDENDDHPGNLGNSGNTGNCAEVKIGPTTVDLPLTPGVVSIPANTIPAGTFRQLELSVSQVRLKGTFDGTAFDVSLPVRVRQEVEFATPIVVTDSAPASVTVNVPVAGWLVNADGSLVDPSKILTTPSLMAAVKARIAASFRAFEDRDHDGKDDHGGRN